MDETLRKFLVDHGQTSLLQRHAAMDSQSQKKLTEQLYQLDLGQVFLLFEEFKNQAPKPSVEDYHPITPSDPTADFGLRMDLGTKALERGELGFLVVAGGQGSRLGTLIPKGMVPVTPITNKSLYQVHAEKILALSRKYHKAFTLLVMTSPATHQPTLEFFQERQNFGLENEQVIFFQQGILPALDIESGELLFESTSTLFANPDGHGGVLGAMHKARLFATLRSRQIRHLFYFQVDNPLVRIHDPLFLGMHIHARSQVSSKSIAKKDPQEKLGNYVEAEGRCHIIEYSDLPMDQANRKNPDGTPFYSCGSPAIHLFDLDFLELMAAKPDLLPHHVARKKVPFLDLAGNLIQPTRENALKFEKFIFDIFPHAERWLVASSLRDEEFAPLKNAEGADSPATVREAQSLLFHDWLLQAGATVDNKTGGNSPPIIEISPLFALDAWELQQKIQPGRSFRGQVLLESTNQQPSRNSSCCTQ